MPESAPAHVPSTVEARKTARSHALESIRPILWTAGLSLSVVLLATVLHGIQLRASALNDYRQELSISARAMALSLSRSLVLTQELLEQVDTLVRETPDATNPELASRLREELRDERLISEIAIVDAQGRIIASSEPRHLGRGTSLTEGVIARATSVGATARLLGPFDGTARNEAGLPPPGAAGGVTEIHHLVLAVPLQARMLQTELGRLSAVAVLPTPSLLAELTSLKTPRTGAIFLEEKSGRFLVQSGYEVPDPPLAPSAAARWLAGRVAGAMVDPQGDGRVWLAREEAIPGFPLSVSARTPLVEIRQGWFRNMFAPIGLLLMSLLVVTFMTRSALRAARQRLALQRQLASRNQQLSNVFEHAGEGIITIGTDGVVREFNRAAQDMLGVSAGEAIGRQLGDLFPPDEVRLHRHMYQLYRDNFAGAPAVMRRSFVSRRLDGRPLAVEFSASKYLEGREGRVIAIIRDVTHTQAAETRFRAIFERSGEPHLLFVGPTPLRIVDCNAAAVSIFRAESREALIGLTAARFVLDAPEDAMAGTLERLRELRDEAGNTGIVQRDLRVRRLDDSILRVHITGTMIPLGDQDGLLISLHDLSTQDAEEEALRKARDAAQAAARAKARFLAVMSHELRTPLTGIIGMIELLDESRLDEEQSRHLGALRTSSRGLLSVVNDILEHSRFEAGKVTLAAEPFDLSALLYEVIETHRPSAQARGNQLLLRLEPLEASRLIGDAQRLRQVLHNLVGNAVKFTQQGEIRLEASGRPTAQGLALHIAVADTGIGIAPEAAARLFQPFAQADPAITRDYGGSGLGLAICKQLIEAMDGTITLESQAGQGARFTITLTLPQAGSLQDCQPALSVVPRPIRPLRVLVAEDNAVNRLLLKTRLEREGHLALFAEDGLQAMAMARSEAPDLILMDMQMPRCDGPTATREIRSWAAPLGRIPIWGLSADALPELQAEHMASGLDGYLTKPVEWPQVQSVLAQVAHSLSGYDAPRESPAP